MPRGVPQRTRRYRQEDSSRQAPTPREPSTISRTPVPLAEAPARHRRPPDFRRWGGPGGVHDPPRPVVLIHLGGNSSRSRRQQRRRVHQAQRELVPALLRRRPDGQPPGPQVTPPRPAMTAGSRTAASVSQKAGTTVWEPPFHTAAAPCVTAQGVGRRQGVEGLSGGLGKGIREHGRRPCGRTTAAPVSHVLVGVLGTSLVR